MCHFFEYRILVSKPVALQSGGCGLLISMTKVFIDKNGEALLIRTTKNFSKPHFTVEILLSFVSIFVPHREEGILPPASFHPEFMTAPMTRIIYACN